MILAYFSYLVCGILVPSAVIPKEDHLWLSTKISDAVFSYAMLPSPQSISWPYMGAVNNSNMVCSDYFVVDDVVYMGTVNNSKIHNIC